MGGILVIQSHERPRAELLNVSALEIPTLPTHGFPSQACEPLLGGDACAQMHRACDAVSACAQVVFAGV